LERGLKDESDCNNVCARNIADRFERLEGKYETMRLATLEWGKDVEKLQLRSDRHLQRIERLEGVKPKIVDLQLTPEQEEGITALLRPNYPAKPDGSPVPSGLLMELVEAALEREAWMNAGLDESVCQDDDPTYRYTSAAIDQGLLDVRSMQARAAISEVAAWLKRPNGVAFFLEEALSELGETTYKDLATEVISVIVECLECEVGDV